MKAKITKGGDFYGIARYALSKDEGVVIAGNIGGTTPAQIASEFEATAGRRPDIKKPVWHCSLAAAPGERLSDEKWGKLAQRFLEDMGFPKDTQYTVIRHEARDDQAGPPRIGKNGKPLGPETQHVHLIVNRVNLEGAVSEQKNDVYRAIDATQRLEKEFKLQRTTGFTGPKPAKAVTRAEAGMQDRLDADAPRVHLQKTLGGILAAGPTLGQFVQQAQAAGIELRANVASNGHMNGFSFSHAGQPFTGSQLGADFKWSTLKQTLGYQPARDTELLRSLSNRPDAPAPAAKLQASPREVIQARLLDAMAGGPTMTQFVQRAQDAGIKVKPSLAKSTERLSGFSFEFGGESFTGQKVGKQFTLSALQKNGVSYDAARDNEFLRSVAAGPQPIITKENEHGRTGLHRRGDRGLGLDAGGAQPAVDGNSGGGRARNESGDRAVEAAARPPAHLSDRLHHLSESHVVLKWGRDAGALRSDVSGRVDLGRGTGRRALFGARGRAPDAATLKLPRTGHKAFRPAGPSFWSQLGRKKKKGELTPQQVEQIKIMVDRLAHMLVKLVCRAFGVDYVTPEERQRFERQQQLERLRMKDLPPKAPLAPEAKPAEPAAKPAPKPVARPVDPDRAQRAELAKASIGKAPATSQPQDAERRSQSQRVLEEIRAKRAIAHAPAPAKPAAPLSAPGAGRPAKPEEDPRDRKSDPREALEERRREDAKRIVAKALATGKGATAALSAAASHGSLEDVEKLLATGKADPSANTKALTEAGKRDPAMLRTMVQNMISAGTVSDHAQLSSLASQLGPEAASQVRQMASDAKAGGSLSSAGFKEPTTPESGPKKPGMSSGPSMSMGGPSGGGGGGGGGR